MEWLAAGNRRCCRESRDNLALFAAPFGTDRALQSPVIVTLIGGEQKTGYRNDDSHHT
jgi:hypothetical protein